MFSIVAFIYFSVTLLIWTRSFQNYKAKVHDLDSERQHEIKEYLSYQDQYWGMLFANRKSFPLYRVELEPYINKVRSTLLLVLSGFIVAFSVLIMENGF
jgi:hypothetical protein